MSTGCSHGTALTRNCSPAAKASFPRSTCALARRPSWSIDPLHELVTIETSTDRVVLGALVRHATLERDSRVAERLPLLSQAMPHVAHAAMKE